MKVAQIGIIGVNVRNIIDLITEEFENFHRHSAGEVEIFLVEKWANRMESSQLMSAYILHFNGDREVKIEIVTGGAKDKAIFDSNIENREIKKIFRKIKHAGEENGWIITKVDPPELEKPYFIERIFGVPKEKQRMGTLGDLITRKMESIFFGKHHDDK